MKATTVIVGMLSACAARSAPPPTEPPPDPATTEIAAPPPARLSEKDAVEAAERELRRRHITLYLPRHKDGRKVYPSEGYLVPVAPIAGGYLYSGVLDKDGKSSILVGKLDADWKPIWELDYAKQGFATYEGGLVGEDPEGNVLAVVPSYITPSTNPVQRVVKLTADGTIIWEVELSRDKFDNSPQIHFAKVAADGSLELAGHTYQGPKQKGDRPALRWTATITRDGKLTDVRVGAAIDWAKDDW